MIAAGGDKRARGDKRICFADWVRPPQFAGLAAPGQRLLAASVKRRRGGI